MSTDSAMLSDDSRPATSSPNGHANGKKGTTVAEQLSDDEEMPLSQVTRTPQSSVQPPRQKRKRAVYYESSSEDDTPLASSPLKQSSAVIPMPGAIDATTVPAPLANGKGKGRAVKEESTDGEASNDAPSQTAKAKTNGRSKRPARKKAKVEEEDDEAASDTSNSSPPAKKKSAPRKRKAKEQSEPKSGDDAPAKKPPVKRATKKVKKEEGGGAVSEGDVSKLKKRGGKKEKEEKEKGKGKKKKEEEEEEVFRWWEVGAGDGSVKWTALEHNGVLFPPPYEPLPPDVKMKYDGKDVDLPPASEEVAGFYAAMIETDHAQDATFNKNFFEDWKKVLKANPPRDGTKIVSFELCDFRPMFQYFEAEKAKKKSLSAAEKKELKKARDEMEAKYTTCLLDGRKEKVGNFRVEPPGLFRGRGEHPKKGALKFRVRPEDITLNIGKDAPIPVPNMPGKWKAIQHDNTVTWLANWTENINSTHKYVFLAAGSSLKGQSDMLKFEKARELKNHVDRIRQNYNADLRSKVMADRQRATAMYFIDKLALRAGNEKGEDEADTVGCCSLRCEHLTLESPNIVIFDFLGKDSIRYYNQVPVDPQVFKNIRIFKENKEDEDALFDRVNTSSLNKHLTSEMKGLTAKVFRTYNASITFQQLLDEKEADLKNATLQEKLNAYNHANRLVAILCNHQRTAPKTHDQSMEKMRYKYRSLKYERMKMRHALFALDDNYKSDDKYADDESDIDDDWITTHEESMRDKDLEKAEKKFEKDNEKLAEDGKEPHGQSVLDSKIEAIKDEYKRLAKERGTKKAKSNKTAEKLEEAIEKLGQRIKAFKLQMVDRDTNKEVALGTSKINYLDPRITAAWCKTHDVPIEKLFSKTLVSKFPWALEADADWKF
ncbi:DNA topoisomerase I [Desarmillaria tabescens]|uniref:DNA topoisomerase I n=1 Tax=Armillaria tabescens TaxID=1929756 RepID=A0AA39TJB5_ARMTA|nr:DNA topoisomerase I [Desarmillaria tabescens]KAK0461067.1 DNA topoisomerase I [Desarmillaria tabescens]